MAKIIWRLPSKAITYGYAEVEATPEELGFEHGVVDAKAIGLLYATYVGAFLGGEKEGLDLFMRGQQEKPAESHTETPEGNPEADTKELIQRELGATVESEEENVPPWQKKAEAKQSKPWEKKEKAPSQGAAPSTEDIDW